MQSTDQKRETKARELEYMDVEARQGEVNQCKVR